MAPTGPGCPSPHGALLTNGPVPPVLDSVQVQGHLYSFQLLPQPLCAFPPKVSLPFQLLPQPLCALPLKVSLPWVGFPGGTRDKEPACQCRRRETFGFDPGVGKIPWRPAWQPTPVFLPGESHGQRSLGGCSPWVCIVAATDVTAHTHLSVHLGRWK